MLCIACQSRPFYDFHAHAYQNMSIPTVSEPSIVIPVHYYWKIGCISLNEVKKSPLFGPENSKSMTFRLHFNHSDTSRETIYLELVSCVVPQVDVYYLIKYANVSMSVSDKYTKLDVGNRFQIGTVIRSGFQKYNPIINCELTILYPYKSVENQLKTDLETLRKDPLFTDVTFVVGSKEFPAHRNILSVRSSVFETMFQQKNFIENQSNRIEVIDIESNVLEALLEFVYTGEVKELVELAADLLVAAHKYQIDSLVKLCESNMTSSISIENASKYLKLADMYSLEELKTKALTFINVNTKEVMQTEGWKAMIDDNLTLMKDLYKNLALAKE